MNYFVAAILLIIGLLFLKYPQKIGVVFCRLGRRSWGTKMLSPYQLDRLYNARDATHFFRLAGYVVIGFSAILLVATVLGFDDDRPSNEKPNKQLRMENSRNIEGSIVR